MTAPSSWLTTNMAGARLILDGRYGVIEDVTSTHARVRFADEVLNLERRGETDELTMVPWPELIGLNAPALLMDEATRTRWENWKPHNQIKTAARLAIVNLITTGCRSGHEGILNAEQEPIEFLRSGGRFIHELKGEIHARVLYLHRWLSTSSDEWVLQLLADWWATGNKKRALKQKVPSPRSMERAVTSAANGGIYALSDQSGGDQYADNDTGQRRRTTETLIDLIVDGRTDASSKKTDEWYVKAVQKEAEHQQVAILGERSVREYVRLKLNKAGRTPTQAKSARNADERTEFQSNRAWAPGMELAYDQTQGDNFVTMVPNGKLVRPNVHVVADVATGVILSVDATGFYRESTVAMTLFDAARPLVVLPDEHGRWLPRIKGMTQRFVLGEGAFKPGGIASTYRSDNIAQNHSRYMVGIMKLLHADISPSLPGRHTDNRHAETTIKGLAKFFQDADAYVGIHAANRGRKAGEDGAFDIDEYRALIQQFAFFDYNHRPTPVPMYKRTGMSRLQLWDHIVAEYGAPHALVDPNAYFSFLRTESRVLSTKGINHDKQMYNSPDLRNLPRAVLGLDSVVTYIADDRQQDCLWVPIPDEGGFLEIPNVLRDLTDAPLTKETTKKARKMSGADPAAGFHAAKAHAHALDQIRQLERPSVNIQRSLADMRAAWFSYNEVQGGGATVLNKRPPLRPTPSEPDPSPKSSPDQTNGGGKPMPPAPPSPPFAHPGPTLSGEDDLDRPIKWRT